MREKGDLGWQRGGPVLVLMILRIWRFGRQQRQGCRRSRHEEEVGKVGEKMGERANPQLL